MTEFKTLKEFFTANPKVALGFSGGVDSSYLLQIALKYGADIQPYFIKTAFQPNFEFEDAKVFAKQVGAKLKIIELDALSSIKVANNDEKRCYYCKQNLFGILTETAKKDGYDLVIDGTNASDDADDRPGMVALRELNVRSPLRECNITKKEIREHSKELGLFTWNKPAYACLATRIPTGTTITNEKLSLVEKAEQALFSFGFHDFRVRLLDDLARVQLRAEQMELFIQKREEILLKLNYFPSVLLDMTPRS